MVIEYLVVLKQPSNNNLWKGWAGSILHDHGAHVQAE